MVLEFKIILCFSSYAKETNGKELININGDARRERRVREMWPLVDLSYKCVYMVCVCVMYHTRKIKIIYMLRLSFFSSIFFLSNKCQLFILIMNEMNFRLIHSPPREDETFSTQSLMV